MLLKRSAFLLFLFVTLAAAAQESYRLQGTILSPDKVEDGVLEIHGETIGAVSSGNQATAISTESYILPGFLDLHNHITWNVFPRWRPYTLFANRYEWQQRPDYAIALDTAHKLLAENHEDDCAANEYGEIKAIVGGVTAIAGSIYTGNTDCSQGLVRNLDIAASSGIKRPDGSPYELSYQVFPFRLTSEESAHIREGLAHTPPVPLIAHVAEGRSTDAATEGEFVSFERNGFLRPGATIIHGVGLKRADFEKMLAAHVGLIWSPRSNIELYGETADVATARALQDASGRKLTIALSPDWSPSGSDGVLQELKYAAIWDAGHGHPVFGIHELINMVTRNPAQLAALDDLLGSIAPGKFADLVLIRRHDSDPKDPYDAIVSAGPADIRLVVIGGTAVYGDTELMSKLHAPSTLEPITICGTAKSLYLVKSVTGYPRPWKEISARLNLRLQQIGTSLAPLTACSGTNLN